MVKKILSSLLVELKIKPENIESNQTLIFVVYIVCDQNIINE